MPDPKVQDDDKQGSCHDEGAHHRGDLHNMLTGCVENSVPRAGRGDRRTITASPSGC